MHHNSRTISRYSFINLFTAALIVFALSALAFSQGSQPAQTAAHTQPASARTPTETVREFYKALRERRFRDAFAISIYKPAIEGLTPEEFEDLRPEFERMALGVPAEVSVSGEQVSGDTATVFVKAPSGGTNDSTTQAPEPLTLIRSNGEWIVGDQENAQVVKASGKRFFFDARLNSHQSDMQAALSEILKAELKYSVQHGGQFGSVQEMITEGDLTQDSVAFDSIGYSFQFNVASDRKSFTGHAEPQRYGQTGRLSFFIDNTGIRSADIGGKPLSPSATR